MKGFAKTWRASLLELPLVAEEVVSALQRLQGRPFVVWLKGDLGAGKTTLTGELLHAFGLPKDVPVLSPTFTYLTEYRTPKGVVGHMDLYRLIDGDEDSVQGFLEDRNFAGLFIEWPERAEKSEYIEKSHVIEIKMDDDPNFRNISFTSYV